MLACTACIAPACAVPIGAAPSSTACAGACGAIASSGSWPGGTPSSGRKLTRRAFCLLPDVLEPCTARSAMAAAAATPCTPLPLSRAGWPALPAWLLLPLSMRLTMSRPLSDVPDDDERATIRAANPPRIANSEPEPFGASSAGCVRCSASDNRLPCLRSNICATLFCRGSSIPFLRNPTRRVQGGFHTHGRALARASRVRELEKLFRVQRAPATQSDSVLLHILCAHAPCTCAMHICLCTCATVHMRHAPFAARHDPCAVTHAL
eukprot:365279-Chlamydomonas_euryale.AAC.12